MPGEMFRIAGRDRGSEREGLALAAANPLDPATYVNLGVFHMQGANAAEAAANFSVALTLDRSSAAAKQGLADAHAAMR